MGQEQEQANLVGVKHGNELNDQPMSANESESLFIDSEETVCLAYLSDW